MEANTNNREPKTGKAKILFIFWRYLPRLVLLGVILIIFSLMGTIGNEKARLEKEKAESQALGRKPVNTVLLDIQPSTIQDTLNLPGMIEPWTRLELMAKLHGSIDEVLVQEGDTVEQGQVIARIEPDDYRIALESAQAAYKLAKSEYERNKVMLKTKAVPLAGLEQSESTMLTAKAAMEDAELKLSRCSIKAPMHGVIRRLDAKVGLLLSIGDPVAEILQIDRLKAVIGIPESDISAVGRLSEVDVTIQALNDRVITGKKHFLASSPETTARLYRLELELDNSTKDILPGMFIRANVIKQTVENAVSVPLYSVITRNNEQFVFIARNDVVHKQPVKLGIIEKWQVQVTDGLQAGDKVVIEGHREVEDGQQIKVIHEVTDPSNLMKM